MSGILVYALHYQGAFNKNSLGAVSEGARLASELGTECHAIVVGDKSGLPDDLLGTLGSYGASVRLALAPLAVIRMDIGHRFSGNDFAGYGLSAQRRERGFVSFFFGYNY